LLTVLALGLFALVLALGFWLRGRRSPATELPTWDCGYGQAAPRAQYTASSLAAGLVTGARFVLLPETHRARVRGLFPQVTRFESHVPDPVLDRALDPAFRLGARGLAFLHVFQTGQLASYLLYVLLTLLFLLIWMVV
jgi:hydrogenase-4 component B